MSGGGRIFRVEAAIKPSANGIKMVLLWSGTGSSFLTRLLLLFIRGMIIRQTQANLETFKNLAETHGTHFPKISKLVVS